MFANSAAVESVPLESFGERLSLTIPVPEYYPTNYGIHIHLPLYRMHGTPMCFALLACRDLSSSNSKDQLLGLLLRRMDNSPNRYYVGLHGMYRPLQPPWHPYFRMFRVPAARERDKSKAKQALPLEKLVVADMYLHSHNPNPQRSRALGIADKQLRLHARTLHQAKPPQQFTFILPGWLVKRLQDMGFTLERPKGKSKTPPPGWTPTKAWAEKDSALTLTMRAPDYHQAVVLFRGPKNEAFALAIGVTETGLAWAEGVVKGTKGSVDGDWDGSGHDAAKRIWSKYSDVGSVEDRGLDKWKYGTRRFGDEKARAVKVTFTPWLADEERGLVGKGAVTYTVGIELRGRVYLELKRLSSSEDPTEKASTSSRIANP